MMSDWTQTNLEVGRRLWWVRAPKAQHSLRYVRQSAPSQRSAAWCSGVFRKSRFVLTSWKRIMIEMSTDVVEHWISLVNLFLYSFIENIENAYKPSTAQNLLRGASPPLP